MLQNIGVKFLMTNDLMTLTPDADLSQAKEIFDLYKIHHIPVEENGKVRGIITHGDMLSVKNVQMGNKKVDYDAIKVKEVMTSNPFCVQKSALLSEALEIMIKERKNALPVRDKDQLVGLITSYDVLKFVRSNI